MKKILIISHWFFPRNNPRSFRARALIDEFLRQGLSCAVYIGEQNLLLEGDELYAYYDQIIDTDSTTRTNEVSFHHEIIKKWMRFFIGEKFLLTSVKRAIHTLKNMEFDVIISIGNPFYSHIIAVLLKKENVARMVISDCGDPFYLGRPKHSILVKLIQKWTFNRIDYLTIPILSAVDYYKKYVPTDKIRVIHQGFSTKGITLKKYNKNNIPKFAYAGAFYEDIRNPELLLLYLSKVNMDFEFHIFTENRGKVYQDVLLKYKSILKEKLQLRPYMKREDCIRELSSFDFLINIENTTSMQSPSKLIDYSIAERPILSIRPDNIDKEQVKKFLEGDYSAAIKINFEDYKIDNIVAKFKNLMEN